jgi:hypothetical protein
MQLGELSSTAREKGDIPTFRVKPCRLPVQIGSCLQRPRGVDGPANGGKTVLHSASTQPVRNEGESLFKLTAPAPPEFARFRQPAVGAASQLIPRNQQT